jgi:tyrosyl-tRNA synthetase
MATIKECAEFLRQNTVKIIPEDGLFKKLKIAEKEKRPLIIKLGADPSAPDIHFGHLVVLKKLRQFQDIGHKIVFIIGDFTGMIGDPAGKSETRNRLTREEVIKNGETYCDQIFKILDPKRTEIRFNSEWFKELDIYDFLDVTSKYTVARMLERDDFALRFKENKPISILEFLYPLIQGYDSVAINADIELGGTDQEFNLLVGRILQERYGKQPQIAMIMPLIEGLDGKKKMSKSLGNYIGINDLPDDMFGKTMSMPDELLPKYITLLSNKSNEKKMEILKSLEKKAANPRDIKMDFAYEMVKFLYSEETAKQARDHFIQQFVKKDIPDNIREIGIKKGNVMDIVHTIVPEFSKGEIKRLLKQGGIKFNDDKITDPNFEIEGSGILRIGKKKIFKIIL